MTEHPERAWELANCRPAHGSRGNPCPVCSELAGTKVFCNQIKSGMSVTRARRIIAEKIAKGPGEKNSPERKKPGSPQIRDDPGRVW